MSHLAAPPTTPVSGPVLFARYAYPPNALGYCGPDEPEAMLGAADGRHDVLLTHLAPMFEGAWPYLELIAGCNGLNDPLDPRVVEAYWVGNRLLFRVPASALRQSLDERFARRLGRRGPSLTEAAQDGLAQHSFHVLAVYPWLGLLRGGMGDLPLQVMDRCRIRPGIVEEVDGGDVVVRCAPLAFVGSRLVIGPEQVERARWNPLSLEPSGGLSRGDVVSLHWDWVCDRLSARQVTWLVDCTAHNLATVNALSRPGPTEATGA